MAQKMVLSILCDLPFVSFLRGATIVLCIASTGCSAAFYGIQPDRDDFRAEGLEHCRQIHKVNDNIIQDCADYENTVRRAEALEKAYLTLERVNRWGIFVGTTIALASVGALTGLYAFGQAASDYAKVIPIAGTFVGGVIASLTNDATADAYADAQSDVRKARDEAEATVKPANTTGRAELKYHDAQNELHKKLGIIEDRTKLRIRAGRPSPTELLKQTADLRKENALLVFAGKYRVTDVQPDPAAPTNKITITLSSNIESDDQKLLADNGVARIDASDVKLASAEFDGATVKVAIPNSVKPAAGSGPKPHGVAMKIGAHLLYPVMIVNVTY